MQNQSCKICKLDRFRWHPTFVPTSQDQSQTTLFPHLKIKAKRWDCIPSHQKTIFPIFISSHSSHLSSQKISQTKKNRSTKYPISPHPHPPIPHLVLLRCARSAARRCLRALGPSAKAPPTTSTVSTPPSSEAPSEISSSEESLSTASSVPGGAKGPNKAPLGENRAQID